MLSGCGSEQFELSRFQGNLDFIPDNPDVGGGNADLVPSSLYERQA